MELLRCYGIPVPGYRLARTVQEAVDGWRELGEAVAVKVNRPHFTHKTDGGWIRLSCATEEDVRDAFETFRSRVAPRDLEVLLQPMVPVDREVIMGGKRDEAFGPVILFGLGGILVEALEDVAWRIAPLTRQDAHAMILHTRGRAVLEGVRGAPPCDLAALEEMLVRLSHMLMELPIIREIDINPINATPLGHPVLALDARVLLAADRDQA